jgi:YD repeat-containing protein
MPLFPFRLQPLTVTMILLSLIAHPTSGSATYLQSIVLPNGTTWTFEYDDFGELSLITCQPAEPFLTHGLIHQAFAWEVNIIKTR